jgi:hypothetical protein
VTEERLASISQNVHEIEQSILGLDIQINRNKADKKQSKLNKALRKQKKRLTTEKNTLEKQ